MYSKTFWADAAERAVKTAAQAALGSFAVGTGFFDLDWKGALGVTLAAVVTSLLTSIASAGVGEVKDASAVAVTLPDYDPDDLPDPEDVTADFDDSSGTPVSEEFEDEKPGEHRRED